MTSPHAVLSVARLARQELTCRDDKLAFVVHAYVLAQGYKLVAVGEAAEDTTTDFFSTDLPEVVDVSGWNALPGSYSFRYQDAERQRQPLHLKCIVTGSKLLVQWAYGGADASPQVLELDIDRFTTTEAAVPAAYQNTDELITQLDSTLGKDLIVAETTSDASQQRSGVALTQQKQQQERENEEEQAGPSYHHIGGDENHHDYDPLREGPPRGGRIPFGIPATGIGYEDVVPPGVRPPGSIREGFPGGGLEGMPHTGGGMHVGPGHPMFGPGKFGESVGVVPGGGRGRGGLPPGARWDPIGPPGTQGFRPDDFQKKDPSRPNPDIMQPGPGHGTDWDSFYG